MTEDTLEGLLDFDTNKNDIFRDVDISMDLPSRGKSPPRAENSKDLSGLGIDEEIQVQKKRKPIIQLNEHRSVPVPISPWPLISLGTQKSSHALIDSSRLLESQS